MRRALIALAVVIVAAIGCYASWSMKMDAHVKRVQASVAHHAEAFAKQDPSVKFTVGKVKATGFPFNSHVHVSDVKIDQKTPFGDYGISLDYVNLESTVASEGRYSVQLPADAKAYFKDAANDEKYSVHLKEIPALLLRAQSSSKKCPNLPGAEPCADAAKDAPLISYAVYLPAVFQLEASSNDKTETIEFLFHSLNVPVFATIPDKAGKQLQLFVALLREALVFKNEG